MKRLITILLLMSSCEEKVRVADTGTNRIMYTEPSDDNAPKWVLNPNPKSFFFNSDSYQTCGTGLYFMDIGGKTFFSLDKCTWRNPTTMFYFTCEKWVVRPPQN